MSIPTVANRIEPTLLAWLRSEFPDVQFATRNPDTTKTVVLVLVDYLGKPTQITQTVNIRLTMYKPDPKTGVLDLDKAHELMSNIQRFLISKGTTSPLVSCDLFTGITRVMDEQVKAECLYSVMQATLIAR